MEGHPDNHFQPMLFHLSEEAGIDRFEPRQSNYTVEPVVWAISEDRLCNYLLPRDCPRVTFYAGPKTSAADAKRFLGQSRAVVAVESAWFERIRSCRLYCYHLPPETFELLDDCAGYFVSHVSVVPEGVEMFEDLIGELLKRDVEVRFMPSLSTLRDEVIASTLQFSLIRIRNAVSRTSR
jgi:uncharacterized protein DUF6886